MDRANQTSESLGFTHRQSPHSSHLAVDRSRPGVVPLAMLQHIQASPGAFTAILGDGSAVTWAKALFGGDTRAVQDQLKNVQQRQATDEAFAARLCD